MTTQLRQLTLWRQGLATTAPFGQGLAGTLAAIEHLGYVQIDTLSVIERAHHHVLWSRVPDYQLSHLNQLVKQQQIFEYWYHAAAYLPIKDYRFAKVQMASIAQGENRYFRFDDQALLTEIIARIGAEGPSKMRDLQLTDKNSASRGKWWKTGPVKRAFEQLFMQGDLMVCERNGMEKVFDLTERCLPEGLDLTMPSLEQYAVYLFETMLRSHGVFTQKQCLHLKTGKALRDAMTAIIHQRLADGVIVAIQGADNTVYYGDAKLMEQASFVDAGVKLLSPFDNAVIHRERLLSLFDYDFKIECYVPAVKRVYGYFCLPILFKGQFVGRVDCKAHREQQQFEVLSLHLERKFAPSELFLTELKLALQQLADFNQCPQLILSGMNNISP